MEHNAIHRLIRKHFRTSVRGDNLPISSATGTRARLPLLWRDLGYARGAEIGVHRGHFSRHILKQAPGVTLWCIDPWHKYEFSRITEQQQQDHYARAMELLKRYVDQGRCHIKRMTSMEAVGLLEDGELDFVFIDGAHEFDHVAPDIIYYSQKVRSGGMVACHDYQAMRRSGVIQAVNAYTQSHKIDPWYVTREVLPTAFWVRP